MISPATAAMAESRASVSVLLESSQMERIIAITLMMVPPGTEKSAGGAVCFLRSVGSAAHVAAYANSLAIVLTVNA